MSAARVAERVWAGDGLAARAARTALRPAGALFASAAHVRGALYDRGVLPSHDTAVPAISVGNLTVGGTGKTPVASWVARQLLDRGARPAIVMRGYGGDEPLVHAVLEPSIRVVTDPDRVRGSATAAAQGADIVVLDDAFQHRRARRVADLVLVGADSWNGTALPLPAGPFREPLSALRRASVAVITAKAADAGTVRALREAIAASAPDVPIAEVRLALRDLRQLGEGAPMPLVDLRGREVLAVAAVGDPRAFASQLEAAGARVRLAAFPDHHAFTAADVDRLGAAAASVSVVVCTLKDAVKLGPLWARAAAGPLWYVSQRVELERGASELDRALDAALSARS